MARLIDRIRDTSIRQRIKVTHTAKHNGETERGLAPAPTDRRQMDDQTQRTKGDRSVGRDGIFKKKKKKRRRRKRRRRRRRDLIYAAQFDTNDILTALYSHKVHTNAIYAHID